MQDNFNSGFYSFPNNGYYLGKIPYELFSKIKKETLTLEKNMDLASFAGHNLSGNIEKEFDLIDTKPEIENFILKIIQEHNLHFKYLDSINYLNGNVPLILENLWVNFQKKYEFNPNHNHSGVFSFVIWVKIPYLLEDEKKLSPGRYSNSNQASLFQFLYTDILGSTRVFNLPIDKTYEGILCLFPNTLHHCVYPFYTSDEYRISVSGNISLKVK